MSQNDQNFQKWWAPRTPAVFYRLERSMSAFEIMLHVPHGCLLGFYKHNFLLAPFHPENVSDMPVRRDMDWSLFFCSNGQRVMLTSRCRKAKERLSFWSAADLERTTQTNLSATARSLTQLLKMQRAPHNDSDWWVFLLYSFFLWIITGWLQENTNLQSVHT